MKDYYYILGIKKDASVEEIKKAYRKLSLKFHPDKNDGDEFFTERFKEINEAFEILYDVQKRNVYDGKTSRRTNQNSNEKSSFNFNPEVEYFRANKNSFEFDEEITFSWKTINADRVTIKPFGIVQPIGQKTYRIKDFKNALLIFELIAENTNIDRQIKYTLKLNNRTFQELYSFFKKLIETEKTTNYRTESENKKQESNYNKKNILVKYETDKGVIMVSQKYPSDAPDIGNEAFQNGKQIMNGKFRMGFMWYLYFENGKIIKVGLK
jgi:curved DNA-binding protein CbpA